MRLRRVDFALAVAGAAAMALSAPPIDLWPIGLLVWVPLAVVVASGDWVRAGLVGWIQGTLAQGAVLAGIPAALRVAGGMSLGGSYGLASLLWLYEGARFAAIALLAAKMVRNRWPVILAFPVALVAVEGIYPMFFPWSTCLFFQSAPVLLQGAEIGGSLVLSLWAGFIDASLATAWLHRSRRSLPLRYGLVAPVGALALAVAVGAARIRGVSERIAQAPVARIGIVQGDVQHAQKRATDTVLLYRSASLELLAGHKVDLLVWPETAISFPVPFEDLPRFLSDRVFRRELPPSDPSRIDVPLLTGMVLDRKPPDSPAHVRRMNPDGTWQRSKPQRFNSAVLATPDGRVRGVYDKRELVDFGETIPWEKRLPWLRRLLPAAGTFSPGSSSAPLRLGDRRILVLICYEDLLAERVRDAVADGDPDLLVNLTSDAWFEHSRVPSLHLALAKLRAIEHRRYLVHATNTGVTAVIDPSGRTAARLPADRVASMIATVRWMKGRTLYEALGRALDILALGIAALMALFRRRGPSTSPQPRRVLSQARRSGATRSRCRSRR